MRPFLCLFAAVLCGAPLRPASAAVATIGLSYLSPDDARCALGLQAVDGVERLQLPEGVLQARFNTATNQLLLAGDGTAIEAARDLVAILDVPPRQIVIEARIVELNAGRAQDVGLDWQALLDRSYMQTSMFYSGNHRIDDSVDDSRAQEANHREEAVGSWDKRASMNTNTPIGQVLRLVEETGAGEVKHMPQIVTTNNRLGEILDGNRMVYAARYASRDELFETETINAGLYLGVTPTLGAAGLLTMDVTAKLTDLAYGPGDSVGERGQIVSNRVLLRDGQTVLLGGLRRTEVRKEKRRVPILGWVLPFFFSRHVDVDLSRDVFVLLTPHVVDLDVPATLELEK